VFGLEYFWPTTFIYWLLFTVTSTMTFAIAHRVIRRFHLCNFISAHIELLVEEVALSQVFPRLLSLSPVSINISSPTLLVYDSSNWQFPLISQNFIYQPSTLLSKTEIAVVNHWWRCSLNSKYCPGQRGFKFVAPCKAFTNVRCTVTGIEMLNKIIIVLWP
jgi:hypothetical protein